MILITLYFKIALLGNVIPILINQKKWYLFVVMCCGEFILFIFCFISNKKEKQKRVMKKYIKIHVD